MWMVTYLHSPWLELAPMTVDRPQLHLHLLGAQLEHEVDPIHDHKRKNAAVFAVELDRCAIEIRKRRVDCYVIQSRPRGFRNRRDRDRKSTRLNSSHSQISYAVFCVKKKIDGYQADSPEILESGCAYVA